MILLGAAELTLFAIALPGSSALPRPIGSVVVLLAPRPCRIARSLPIRGLPLGETLAIAEESWVLFRPPCRPGDRLTTGRTRSCDASGFRRGGSPRKRLSHTLPGAVVRVPLSRTVARRAIKHDPATVASDRFAFSHTVSLVNYCTVVKLQCQTFMGVGSEVYMAIRMGRKAVGVELKPSYYRQACKNIQAAPVESGETVETTLFGNHEADGEVA